MALARMTQRTTKRLFGFGDGCYNLALTQRKKYQLPLDKSGFVPFSPRSVWSHSLSTVVNYGIGYREKQFCHGYWRTNCGYEIRSLTTNNPFEEKVDNTNNEILRGSDVSNPSKVGGKRPRDSESDSHEPNPKRPNLGGESNLDRHISANALANVMSSDLAVHVDLEKKGNGAYVLNIKMDTQSSTADDKVERAEQMAQKAVVLLLYGEMLLHMGNKLRAQSLASLCSAFQRPAPSNAESDVE